VKFLTPGNGYASKGNGKGTEHAAKVRFHVVRSAERSAQGILQRIPPKSQFPRYGIVLLLA
jgi:hypothetical protein